MEIVISLILAASTLIGTIWGIVKYYDIKQTKKEQALKAKEEAEKKQQDEKLTKALNAISKDLADIKDDNAHQHAEISTLQTEVRAVKKQMDEDEMDRLRSDIIDCVNKLQNGFIMSQADFEHIHHSYDKYVSRNGNSYIASCMEYVTDYEEECRRNGIGVGFDANPQ